MLSGSRILIEVRPRASRLLELAMAAVPVSGGGELIAMLNDGEVRELMLDVQDGLRFEEGHAAIVLQHSLSIALGIESAFTSEVDGNREAQSDDAQPM